MKLEKSYIRMQIGIFIKLDVMNFGGVGKWESCCLDSFIGFLLFQFDGGFEFFHIDAYGVGVMTMGLMRTPVGDIGEMGVFIDNFIMVRVVIDSRKVGLCPLNRSLSAGGFWFWRAASSFRYFW